MLRTVQLTLLAALVSGASGACLNLKQFGNATCQGEVVRTIRGTIADREGSACLDVGDHNSVKNQFCDRKDGTFKQDVFEGKGCQGTPTLQTYVQDVCTYGFELASCDEEDCAPASETSCLTLHEYKYPFCIGAPREIEATLPSGPGSACINMGKYSVKDQYCDLETGQFKQAVFPGSADCSGRVMTQVWDEDTCKFPVMFPSWKLASCRAGPCSNSHKAAERGKDEEALALFAAMGAPTQPEQQHQDAKALHPATTISLLALFVVAACCFFLMLRRRSAQSAMEQPLVAAAT